MDKIYNKNKSKPLFPNDLRVSEGGKKTPMIEITNISGMPDCENTLLMSDSAAGRFRMTKNTEGRGEAKEFTLNSLPLPLGANFPGSEDIEPACAKHKRRNCPSNKEIQDRGLG